MVRCIGSFRRSRASRACGSRSRSSITGLGVSGAQSTASHARFRVVFDLVTVKFLLSYSTRPLQMFGPAGLFLGGIGTLITLYLGYVRLFDGQAIGDRPLLLLAILMVFTGMQLITLGLLAEMQARTYHESAG